MADDADHSNVAGNLRQSSTWLRLVYMLVLGVALGVTEVIFVAVVVLQFLAKLFTGHPLKHLTAFGNSLADYMAQIVRFETFASEDLAFPFAAWPSPAHHEPVPVSSPRKQHPAADKAGDTSSRTSPDVKDQPKKKPRPRRAPKTEAP